MFRNNKRHIWPAPLHKSQALGFHRAKSGETYRYKGYPKQILDCRDRIIRQLFVLVLDPAKYHILPSPLHGKENSDPLNRMEVALAMFLQVLLQPWAC